MTWVSGRWFAPKWAYQSAKVSGSLSVKIRAFGGAACNLEIN